MHRPRPHVPTAVFMVTVFVVALTGVILLCDFICQISTNKGCDWPWLPLHTDTNE